MIERLPPLNALRALDTAGGHLSLTRGPAGQLDMGATEFGSSDEEAATMALKRPRVEADLLLAIDIQKGSDSGRDCTVADVMQAMTRPVNPTRLKRDR